MYFCTTERRTHTSASYGIIAYFFYLSRAFLKNGVWGSNFDLSSTLFARTWRYKKVFIQLFSKSWRGVGRVAPHTALSFVSFSLDLFFQRKAAKDFCYQDLLDAFSFETIGTKEKALQKENADYRSSRWASAFEKAEQNNRLGLREHPDKSQFI